ncbi:MAG: 16S rRNA (uracil(1498)-N(3))-methyltransferase [Clostridia bacterium]|nr:16S rRNA (uracil(1498)-N(3))-methyltransferase [Clostridia bacterium]
MPRFFVPSENINDRQIRITGSDAAHITRSLRMAKGEKLTVCDMHSAEYECEIAGFENTDVLLDVISVCEGNTEPPYKVTLFQALPKSDKMDFIVQKAVETGVFEIVPFISERCISRPEPKSARSKLERWNKIAHEAAKQCGRGIVPQVKPICQYKEALALAADAKHSILFYEGDGVRSLKDVLEGVRCTKDEPAVISVIVGAEGGFSINEVAEASKLGIVPTGLGNRILRCETAPIVALSALSYALEL